MNKKANKALFITICFRGDMKILTIKVYKNIQRVLSYPTSDRETTFSAALFINSNLVCRGTMRGTKGYQAVPSMN